MKRSNCIFSASSYQLFFVVWTFESLFNFENWHNKHDFGVTVEEGLAVGKGVELVTDLEAWHHVDVDQKNMASGSSATSHVS